MDYHAKEEMVVDQFLLGMGNHELSVPVAAHGHRCMEDIQANMVNIRRNLEVTEQETDSSGYNGHVPISVFTPATSKEIKEIIMNSPNKSCNLDPMPTWLLKSCVDSLIPIFLEIVNQSLASGEVPQNLKTAHIRPLLRLVWIERTLRTIDLCLTLVSSR